MPTRTGMDLPVIRSDEINRMSVRKQCSGTIIMRAGPARAFIPAARRGKKTLALSTIKGRAGIKARVCP